MKNIVISLLLIVLTGFTQQIFAGQISDAELQQAIQDKLYSQTGDSKASKEMAKFVFDNVLTWKAKEIDIKKANSILAFSFGNRYARNGNQLPGKMNEEIANTVVKIYHQIHVPVYAQWEVAQAIGNRVPQDKLHAIYPQIDGEGLVYLDTKAVAVNAIKQAGGAAILNKAVVVAFREHELRAVNTSKELGIDAYAPKNISLPDSYDKNSGQPWTRDKLTFMLYEIRTRANIFREELSGNVYKK